MNNRIFIFADLHYGEPKKIEGRKLNQPSQSLLNLRKILNKIKLNKNKDMVVLLGDINSKSTKGKDIRHILAVLEAIGSTGIKPFCVAGNHELTNLIKKEVISLFELKRFYDVGLDDAHLIFLDSMHEGYELYIDDEQINWLKKKVTEIKKPLILFSHSPLIKYDVRGNVWLEGREEKAYIRNWQEVSKILKTAKGSVTCISGHVHQDRQIKDGRINHITLQSFAENITSMNEGNACKAYALLEIKRHRIIIYNSPKEYIIPIESIKC